MGNTGRKHGTIAWLTIFFFQAYPGMAPQAYNPQGNWGAPGGYQQQQWGQQPQVNDTSVQQPPQQPVNPAAGQADYSLQWAEYYRSLGKNLCSSVFSLMKVSSVG